MHLPRCPAWLWQADSRRGGYLSPSLFLKQTFLCFKRLLQVVAFVGFYVVTLPSAYSLGFPAKLQQQGLWIGMVIGYVFVSGLYVWVVYRLDWNTASAEAVRISAVVPLVLVDD